MTILKRLARQLPVLKKNNTCPACGESFACELSLTSGCWCSEIKLSDDTRQKLRAEYSGCLCRACLENAEAQLSRGDEMKLTRLMKGDEILDTSV